MEKNKSDLKGFLNEIFAKKGISPVKNIPIDFADGSNIIILNYVIKSINYLNTVIVLFEKLFNILYDERVDCKLIKSPLLDVKIQNWNKINASICFNYL